MMAVLMVGLGIVGVVGLVGHSWLILLASNIATCALFVGLFSLMVVAMMVGYNYTDPVKDATALNWKTTEIEDADPARVDAEKVGVCKPLLGPCAEFYPALEVTMAQNVWALNAPAECSTRTEFDFATDCMKVQECRYDLANSPRYGCKACDEE